jgi:hypothetical protein
MFRRFRAPLTCVRSAPAENTVVLNQRQFGIERLHWLHIFYRLKFRVIKGVRFAGTLSFRRKLFPAPAFDFLQWPADASFAPVVSAANASASRQTCHGVL